MSKHKIGWLNRPGTTGETWNPVIGCSKASAGCHNCYAERMARRQAYMRPGCEYEQVLAYYEGRGFGGWSGVTSFVVSALEKPLHWRKPRTVFVCSMGDLFHETVPFEWIDQVFAVMALCPQHTFIVLTKRPELMAEYLNEWFPQWDSAMDDFPNEADIDVGGYLKVGADYWGEYSTQVKVWPLPNVWLGTTVENKAALPRLDYLRQCPAAVRLVSNEPSLEDLGDVNLTWIDWVICGGEAGPGARPMHPEWARSLRDQCKAAGVPFYFKQWGEYGLYGDWQQAVIVANDGTAYKPHELAFPDGSRRAEAFRKDHQRAELYHMYRVGKKAAGNELDSKTYDEFPEVL